ncbi:unnamed protein product [Amoebophrya sp. A25]|nr:unnamed protein product [Amoebophrya sp. A25]|eukprot:GSA25T00009143001.1
MESSSYLLNTLETTPVLLPSTTAQEEGRAEDNTNNSTTATPSSSSSSSSASASASFRAGSTSKEVIVVVDPYSTGRELVRELLHCSARLIAVQSSLELAPFWLRQLEPACFEECFLHEDGDVAKTCGKITAKYPVKCVVAGSEPGVLLAEEMSAFLGLKNANDAETKEWRRHKYAMQERVRECGLRAVRQIYSDSVAEVLEWQQKANFGRWPIIVKPACSGGTDGVYWCNKAEDVEKAFGEELAKVNCNGACNEKLLAQEFLEGTEYVVDSTSFEGRHVLGAVWRYKKILDKSTNSIAYELAECIESEGEVQDQLVRYMWQCLDALGIRYGASHGEAIMTKDGPCLIEVGARLHGGRGPIVTQLASGLGCHELLADVLTNHAKLFNELHRRNYRYVMKKRALEYLCRNVYAEGTLKTDLDHGGRLSSLPGVVEVRPSVRVGEQLSLTRDMATSPCSILMCSVRQETVEATISQIKAMEESGELYQVEEKAVVPAISTGGAVVGAGGRTLLESDSDGVDNSRECPACGAEPGAAVQVVQSPSRRGSSASSSSEDASLSENDVKKTENPEQDDQKRVGKMQSSSTVSTICSSRSSSLYDIDRLFVPTPEDVA